MMKYVERYRSCVDRCVDDLLIAGYVDFDDLSKWLKLYRETCGDKITKECVKVFLKKLPRDIVKKLRECITKCMLDDKYMVVFLVQSIMNLFKSLNEVDH